jgi:IS66 Orf2 like protein
MIQITATMRVLVAIEPVDLRKGIDGLAQFCRKKLTADPFSGCLFIFRSRRGTAIKALAQYCSLNDPYPLGKSHMSCWLAFARTQRVIAHLSFDPTWVDSLPTRNHALLKDFVEDGFV